MKIDLASAYYSTEGHVRLKLKPWEMRSRIKHYQFQLDQMTNEGRAVVAQKIREWERCIA